jgi:hypothetical protein
MHPFVLSIGCMHTRKLTCMQHRARRASVHMQVIRMLVGSDELPWVGEPVQLLEARLGKLKKVLLELLLRDASCRPPLQQVADICRAIVARGGCSSP